MKRRATLFIREKPETREAKKKKKKGGDEPYIGWQRKLAHEVCKRQMVALVVLVAVAIYSVRTLAVNGING